MPTFVFLSGTVDGEIRRATVGTPPKPVANFRMATNPGYYSVAAWGSLSDLVPPAGTSIQVTGKLSSRSYDKDGQKHVAVEVVASTIEVIGAAAPADDLIGD